MLVVASACADDILFIILCKMFGVGITVDSSSIITYVDKTFLCFFSSVGLYAYTMLFHICIYAVTDVLFMK
jgi:hypothetical protein